MSREELFAAWDTLYKTFSDNEEAVGEAGWSGVSTAKYDQELREKTKRYFYGLEDEEQTLLISYYIRDRYFSDEAIARGMRHYHVDLFTYWITYEL